MSRVCRTHLPLPNHDARKKHQSRVTSLRKGHAVYRRRQASSSARECGTITLVTARDDQFLGEQGHREAVASMYTLLQNHDRVIFILR